MTRYTLDTFDGTVSVELVDGDLRVTGAAEAATFVRRDLELSYGVGGRTLFAGLTDDDLEIAMRSERMQVYSPRPA